MWRKHTERAKNEKWQNKYWLSEWKEREKKKTTEKLDGWNWRGFEDKGNNKLTYSSQRPE